MILKNFKGLVLTGGLAGALYALNLLIGGALSWGFGIFGLSGLITGIPIGFTFYTATRLTKSFGTVTLLWTLYSLFAIPTPLMGPPVPHKVFIGFIAGIVYDIIIFLLRYKPVSYYLAFTGYIITLIWLFITIFIGTSLDHYAEDLSDTLKAIINLVFIIEGLLSTWWASRWWRNNVANTPLEYKFTREEAHR